MMRYFSTRSALTADSAQAVLQGLAPDGGLYSAALSSFSRFDWRSCLERDSLGMETAILSYLLPELGNMESLVNAAYAGKFETDALTPLVPVGDRWMLELFRGPTSAFKDVALSMLPHLMRRAREVKNLREDTVILTATSGDTGKAALEGFHDVSGFRIMVFYPHEGVSAIQRAQMVTQEGKNVTVCAVRGNFDDCQSAVKTAFVTLGESGQGGNLSSANSINIGRLAPQIAYYFIAYRELLERGALSPGEEADFVVPTGNFGDILAGYYAKLLGLPVGRLVCASNANRVLTDFFRTGVYDRRREFHRTSSPSMDILVSSNLERLLYLASGEKAETVCAYMDSLKAEGFYRADGDTMAALRECFSAYACSESETAAAIRRVWEEDGTLIDPHTAVAFHAAEAFRRETGRKAPLVVLSTASPYKFVPDVLAALGESGTGDEFEAMARLSALTHTPIPPNLASLRGKTVRHTDVIDKADIVNYIRRKREEKK